MTLEQLLALLDAGTITKEQFADAKAVILASIDAEKTKGIDSYRKKDNEALKLKNALKTLGYNKDEVDGVDEFINSIKSKVVSTDGKDVALAELKSQIDTLMTNMANKDKETLEAKTKAERATITNELTKAIGTKFNASNLIIDSLVNSNKLKVVDDKVVFVGANDSVVTFDDGIKGLYESHKDLVKSEQRQGSETTKNAPGSLNFKDIGTMSAEDGLKALGL